MYDTGMADRLRAEGLDVVECDGWQTRGRSELYPGGFVFHHTADGPNGATPSLNGVIYGFAGSAPGPLANLLQSREPDGRDKVYVVAAGTANHAGSGGWRGLSGNSSVWGLEIEHTGTEHFPEERAQIAVRIAAAVIRGTADETMCCQHFEWSTAGKIDVAQDVDADHWRDLVRDALAGKAPEPEIDWAAIAALVAEEQRRQTMGAVATYDMAGVLQCDYVDDRGNLVHNYSSGGGWERDVIAGPDAPAGRCNVASDPNAGVSFIKDALGDSGRLDIYAQAADGTGAVHGYFHQRWGWNSDLIGTGLAARKE